MVSIAASHQNSTSYQHLFFTHPLCMPYLSLKNTLNGIKLFSTFYLSSTLFIVLPALDHPFADKIVNNWRDPTAEQILMEIGKFSFPLPRAAFKAIHNFSEMKPHKLSNYLKLILKYLPQTAILMTFIII